MSWRGYVLKGLCPEGVMPWGGYVLRGYALTGLCPKGVMPWGGYALKGLCREGVMSWGGYLLKGLCRRGLFPRGYFLMGLYPRGLYPRGLFPRGVISWGVYILTGLWSNGMLCTGRSQREMFNMGVRFVVEKNVWQIVTVSTTTHNKHRQLSYLTSDTNRRSRTIVVIQPIVIQNYRK